MVIRDTKKGVTYITTLIRSVMCKHTSLMTLHRCCMSAELALAIPSGKSRMMNQMVPHKTQRLYWFEQVVLYIQFEGGSLYIRMLGYRGSAASSYKLECRRWDPDRGAPTPPYIA